MIFWALATLAALALVTSGLAITVAILNVPRELARRQQSAEWF